MAIMAIDPVMDDLVVQLLSALEDIPVFDYEGYRESVKGFLGVDKNAWNQPCTAQVCGEDPDGSKDLIQRFKVQTIALGVSRNGDYGFNEQVVTDGFHERFAATASGIVVPIYRDHIEKHLSSRGFAKSVADMSSDQGFVGAYLNHVIQPEFIVDSMIAKFSGAPHYTEAIAYLYERFRPLMKEMPDDKTLNHPLLLKEQPVNSFGSSRFGEVDVIVSVATADQRLKDQNQTQDFLNKNLPLTWSDNAFLQKPRFQDLGLSWTKRLMADEFATGIVRSLIHDDEFHKDYMPAGNGLPMYTVTCGDKLWQWMRTQQDNGFGDVFQVRGVENETQLNQFTRSSGGCFAADAELALVDQTIPISALGPGMRVLTQAPDQFATSSTERVEHSTTLGQSGNMTFKTTLFGFNGEKPFVSAGHIFNTLSGPKAIQPSIARLENDDVVVGTLHPGDILLRLNQQHSGYDQVEIKSISSAPASTPTIHGVHFAKGAKASTYHVNGHLVRENYPELTIDNMMKRYHAMSLTEQKSFSKTVRQLPKSFAKVIGPVVFSTVKAKFSNPKPAIATQATGPEQSLLQNLEQSKRRQPSFECFSGIYTLASHSVGREPGRVLDTTHPDFDQHLADLHSDDSTTQLVVHHGVVGTKHGLATHASMSHMGLQWSRKLPGSEDMYEHGALRSVFHGFAASGYTAVGPAEADSIDDMTSVRQVMAMATANTYNVQCTGITFASATDAFKANTTDPDNWTSWWTLKVGLSFDPSGAASVVASLPDLDRYYLAAYPKDAPDAPLYTTAPIVYSKGQITINVTTVAGMGGLVFTPLLDSWAKVKPPGDIVSPGPAFGSFAIVINIFTSAVHGYYAELMPDDAAGQIHALAVSAPSASLAARDHVNSMNAQEEASIDSVSGPEPALLATQLLASKFFDSENLSIADLQSLAPSDATQLNGLSQTYMHNASTYWRGGDEIKVFGDDKLSTATALPPSGSLTNNLDGDARAWLAEYQKGILMQALQRNSKYSGKFSSDHQNKLDYYFQGGQDGCLASNAQCNKVTKICASEAFLADMPHLMAYIEDSKDWAEALYKFVTQDEQSNNQAFAMLLSPDANVTNYYCMTLNALSRGGKTYDVDLWNLVRDKIIVSPSNAKIKTDELPAFMQQFVTSLITQVQAGASGELFHLIKIDLQDIYAAYETQVAHEIAERLFNGGFEMGQCFLELDVDFRDIMLLRNKISFAEMMEQWEAKIMKKFPNKGPFLVKCLRYGTALIGLGMDAFGIYMSVKYFMGWGDLDESERASAVIGLIQTVTMTARDLGGLYKIMQGEDPGSFDYKIACRKYNNAIGSKDIGGRNVAMEDSDGEIKPLLNRESIEAIQNPNNESMSEKMAVKVGQADVEADLVKDFGALETAIAVIAIAADIASCVCMGLQIKADFDDGEKPNIKAMDIIAEVTTRLQVISGIVELGAMVMGVDCIAIPVVGFVLAFMGVVLMFCEIFVPRSPPPDPLEEYLNDHLDDFFRDKHKRPDLALAYDVTPSVTLNQQGSVVVRITNPRSSDLKFTSLSIAIPAGDEDTQLFIPPSGKDTTVKPNKAPTTNLVTYTLNSDQTVFQVTGSPVPNNSDSTLVARITPAGKATSAQFPAGGRLLLVLSMRRRAWRGLESRSRLRIVTIRFRIAISILISM